MSEGNPARAYSPLDRLVHRLAFSGPLRASFERAEAARYAEACENIGIGEPVVIAGLPRAGSTALLQLLAGHPAFASPSYADMPMITAPLLWNDLTGAHRRRKPPTERAHGDGVPVDTASPEAFDEVLWMRAWPRHYQPREIELWDERESPGEFAHAYANWLRRVTLVRRRENPAATRPLLKSNASIARLRLVEQMLPGTTVLVPYRRPAAQAASLHRQHLQTCGHQAAAPFVRRYMDDLGHFEFGQGLKRIAFPRLAREQRNPGQLAYWEAYWVDTYAYLLANLPRAAILVDYDRACENGALLESALGAALGVAEEHFGPVSFTVRRSAPPPPSSDLAQKLWERLRQSGQNLL